MAETAEVLAAAYSNVGEEDAESKGAICYIITLVFN